MGNFHSSIFHRMKRCQIYLCYECFMPYAPNYDYSYSSHWKYFFKLNLYYYVQQHIREKYFIANIHISNSSNMPPTPIATQPKPATLHIAMRTHTHTLWNEAVGNLTRASECDTTTSTHPAPVDDALSTINGFGCGVDVCVLCCALCVCVRSFQPPFP